jgi:hypothetical protein
MQFCNCALFPDSGGRKRLKTTEIGPTIFEPQMHQKEKILHPQNFSPCRLQLSAATPLSQDFFRARAKEIF